MQRLETGMLERYDIPVHRPASAQAVQFGLDDAMLGVADRLLEGTGLGIVCVAGGKRARLLREQQGLYTVLVRGYEGENAVRREQVVQAIVEVAAREEIPALAQRPELSLGILSTQQDSVQDLAAFLKARFEAGLDGLCLLCVTALQGGVEAMRRRIMKGVNVPGFEDWLDEKCAFAPMLVDGLAFRTDAKEAAKICADMNYADGMLHIAEPYAHLTIEATEALRRAFPLNEVPGVTFVEDIRPALYQKQVLFDVGVLLLAAPGWLLGCDTLCDCMKHERLRRFAGTSYVEELIPLSGLSREEAAPRIISAFERFENPLNRNGLLACAAPMMTRFRDGVVPLMRCWAEEHFEPPRHLAYALAAAIMLYAGARREVDAQNAGSACGENGTGAGSVSRAEMADAGRAQEDQASPVYTIARGKQVYPLEDDEAILRVFSTLSHDMPPETLAYAVLADRELWGGEDLREIDGLAERVALDIAAMQRDPGALPEK